MRDPIFDNNFVGRTPDYSTSRLMNWSALLFLWAGVIACIAENGPLDWKVIIGVIFLFLTTTLSYSNFQRGVRTTLALILMGMLGWITFFPVQYTISFGTFSFDLLFIVVGFILYYTNKPQLSIFFKGIFQQNIPEQEISAIGRSRINTFKHRFAHKELSELAAITMNPRLLPEAIQAAEELLEERAWV